MYVRVKIYDTRANAEIAKVILEANGIKAVINEDVSTQLAGTLMNLGVQVLVDEKDLDEAKKLLEES